MVYSISGEDTVYMVERSALIYDAFGINSKEAIDYILDLKYLLCFDVELAKTIAKILVYSIITTKHIKDLYPS